MLSSGRGVVPIVSQPRVLLEENDSLTIREKGGEPKLASYAVW